MKNSNSFRYKFNLTTWILLGVVLAVSLVSVGLNAYNLSLLVKSGSSNFTIRIIMLVVSVLLTLFVISVISFSFYKVKNDCVYTYFGFIRSKTNVNDIVQFTHFKKSNKLVAYFKDEKYIVIVVSPQDYDGFIQAVRELNPKIIFDMQEQEN